MKFFDRLLTIVITATLVSAFWIVFGVSLIENLDEEAEDEPSAVSAPNAPDTQPALENERAPATTAVPDTAPSVTAPAVEPNVNPSPRASEPSTQAQPSTQNDRVAIPDQE